jgi:branched-chain amino acid transport system substrate-binding protein
MRRALWAGACLSLMLGGAASADISIGVAGPISGQFAAFGEQMRAGAELAVVHINARGGVLGERLVLEVGDDSCDPSKAVAVANHLAGRGVVFVAGHFCSTASIPASTVYAEEEIIQISPASLDPRLTEDRPGPGIFRLAGRYDRQGQVAGAFLAETFADRRVGIVHDGTAYGKGLADAGRAAMEEAGERPILYEAYNPGESDYSGLVSRLNAAAVEVLFLGGYHTEAGLVARELRRRGMDTVLVSGDALVTEEFWAIAGPAAEGTLMTYPPDPRKEPAAQPAVEGLEAKGIDPQPYAISSYAAIEVWAQAAEAAGSTAFAAVVEALNEGGFETALGTVSFDDAGDATLPGFVIYEWRDGWYDYFDAAAERGLRREREG